MYPENMYTDPQNPNGNGNTGSTGGSAASQPSYTVNEYGQRVEANPSEARDSYSYQFRPADGSSVVRTAPQSGGSGGGGKGGPTWGRIIAVCLAFTLVGGAVGGGIGGYLGSQNSQNGSHTSPVTTQGPVVNTSVNSGDGSDADFSALYENCNPACVAISGSGTDTNIFGQMSQYASAGSGFIISQDGYIVTNHHVIDGLSSIEVLLSDGTTYPAKVVGSDATADIALLKIEASGLPYVSFGDSDQLKVGQTVAAIGNPLGELANTMTTGVISALDREINIDGTVMNVLQTNTAVSPGNSGCPLFDASGAVIGVINSKSGGTSVEGIGFAIPANDAVKVINDIMEYGFVRGRAALGVTINSNYNSTYARYYNLPEGAYVQEVSSGSAANKAGIQANDIITKIGDHEIAGYSDLKAALQKYSAGETVKVTVSRSGETLELDVTMDEKAAESSSTGGETAPSQQPENEEDQNPQKLPGLFGQNN